MGGQGGDGGAAAAAAPSTVPPRGADRTALLEQRKKEVQGALVVGPLVKVAYAEAWTTRAGEAMSSGYGKHVLKRKLCHVWGGDKPDGFDPSACQTYRDIDHFLAEPDEEKSSEVTKAHSHAQREYLVEGLDFLLLNKLLCVIVKCNTTHYNCAQLFFVAEITIRQHVSTLKHHTLRCTFLFLRETLMH